MKKNKIFLNDWLKNKPYTNHNSVDIEYINLSNKVYNLFQEYFNIFEMLSIDDNEIKELSIFLVCYLEDLVSDTNIWKTFVKINSRNYKKPVPFYSTKDYRENEVNIIDIQFLIWYFFNIINPNRFLSPYDEYLYVLANNAFTVLDEEFDYISENELLKKSYLLKNNADYYEVRKTIQKYLFESYLFGIDTKQKLEIKIADIFSENENIEDSEYFLRIYNSIVDELTISNSTKLLSLRGKEWLREIIGENNETSNDIESISDKIIGFFFFKGENELNYIFENIATEKIFEVTKDSYIAKINPKDDTIYYIELVNWKDNWVLSGITMQQPFNADLILDQKNSIEARNIILTNEKVELNEIVSLIKKQEKAFIEYFGSKIVFISSKNIQTTIQNYHDFYNNYFAENKDNETIDQIKNRHKKKGFFYDDKNIDYDFGDSTILLFFNENTGLEIYQDIASIFPDEKNPFKEKENIDLIKQFLFSDEFSKEITKYFINSYSSNLNFFKTEIGKKYLKDIDFLMRFWKNSTYNNKPTTTLI